LKRRFFILLKLLWARWGIRARSSKKAKAIQISFEDLLGGNYNEPQFVKVDDVAPLPPETVLKL
jgi:hypothetical protein